MWEYIERLDPSKQMDYILQSWLYKSIAGVILSTIAFLIGPSYYLFGCLWAMIFFDLISKWASVAKNTLKKCNDNGSIWHGFIMAWHTGDLKSQVMREKFYTKTYCYIVLIIAVGLLSKIIGQMNFWFVQWDVFTVNFVYAYLSITEFSSILENLIAMDMPQLRALKEKYQCKTAEMLGVPVNSIKGDVSNGITTGDSSTPSEPSGHSDAG